METNKSEVKQEDEIVTMNGDQVKSMIDAGINWLKTNQQVVNALNVFPVPDGDTGTNMLLTMQAAWTEVLNSNEKKVGGIMKAVAQGALMGARGNSGVILSQFWRGFSRALDNTDDLTIAQFSQALNEAKATAYKGVVRPVEGTILTVLKDTADTAEKELPQCHNFKDFLAVIVKAASESVDRTPELLPVLKQAGVVDSGGKGLFYIFEGFNRWLNHESLDVNPNVVEVVPFSKMNENETEQIEPGQDFEDVIDFIPSHELNLPAFYDRLSDMGTSIQVGEGDGMYRMHIHVPTENLYTPIDYIRSIGTVTKVAIENLVAQMDAIQKKKDSEYELTPIEEGQIATVVVSPGEGISKIFSSLGAASIVQGGQTMNPSTEEILNAINSLPTDKVIVLPNNKNIILSANNAITQTNKKVAVIRSKNVPQGITAILHLDPDGDFDQIVQAMTDSLTDVESGEITCATRSVDLDGVSVKEGQYIALHNGKLVISADSLEDAMFKFLEEAKTEDFERITIFYGSNIEKDTAMKMVDQIKEKYPDHEIEVHYGGQPHYFFIIAIE